MKEDLMRDELLSIKRSTKCSGYLLKVVEGVPKLECVKSA